MTLDRILQADARALLRRAGYHVFDNKLSSVLASDRDSILFRGILGQPNTAWIDRGCIMAVHCGFEAEPPFDLHWHENDPVPALPAAPARGHDAQNYGLAG